MNKLIVVLLFAVFVTACAGQTESEFKAYVERLDQQANQHEWDTFRRVVIESKSVEFVSTEFFSDSPFGPDLNILVDSSQRDYEFEGRIKMWAGIRLFVLDNYRVPVYLKNGQITVKDRLGLEYRMFYDPNSVKVRIER